MKEKVKNLLNNKILSLIIIFISSYIIYQIMLYLSMIYLSIWSPIFIAICLSLIIGELDNLSNSDDGLTKSILKGIPGNQVLLSITLALFLLVAQLVLNVLIAKSANSTNEAITMFANISSANTGSKLSLFLIVGILSPMIEELLCRYLVFNRLTDSVGVNKQNWIAAIVSSIIFLAIHALGSTMPDMIIYFVMSMIYCYLYMYTKNILAPIIMHATFNSIIVLMLLSTM